MNTNTVKETLAKIGRQAMLAPTFAISLIKTSLGYRSLSMDEKFRDASRVLNQVGTANHVPKTVEVNGKMVPIPEDLRDKKPDYTYLANGQPVATVLTNPDKARGADKPMHGIVGLFLFGVIWIVAGGEFASAFIIQSKPVLFGVIMSIGFIPAGILYRQYVVDKLAVLGGVLLLDVKQIPSAMLAGVKGAFTWLKNMSFGQAQAFFEQTINSPHLPLLGLFFVASAVEAAVAVFVGSPFAVLVAALVIESYIAIMLFEEDGRLAALLAGTCGAWLLFAYSDLTKPQGGTFVVGSGESAQLVTRDRDTVLHYQALENHAAPANLESFQDAGEIRVTQATNAAKDTTPFIEYGTALEVLRNNGDLLAPDFGMPIGQTIHDQNTHVIITGGTGSGKSVFLKKVIRQTSKNPNAGWICLDAKNKLPKELVGLCADYKLISPSNTKLNLLAGMLPLQVREAIAIRGDSEEGDWYQRACDFLDMNLQILDAAVKIDTSGTYRWTSDCIEMICIDNITEVDKNDKEGVASPHGQYRSKAIELASKLKDKDKLLVRSLNWMTSSAAASTIRSKGFASSTPDRIKNWLAPLFADKGVAEWACSDAADGFDVADVLYGAHIGIDLGKGVSAATTAVINSLIAQRIFIKLEERDGTDWWDEGQTAVIFFIDELQNVVNDLYADKLAVVRSSGGRVIGATQSLKAIREALGEAKADAMLTNFISGVFLKTNDGGLTYAEAAFRAGVIDRPVSSIKGVDGQVQGIELGMGLAIAQMEPRDGGADLLNKKNLAGNALKWVSNLGGDALANAGYGITTNGAKATHAAITPDEIAKKLRRPYTAFAIVQRGDVMRGDFINLTL